MAITKTFQYGDHEVVLETGVLARQASGSVTVKMGDTMVLVAAVVSRPDPNQPPKDFFPLSVHYQEKSYAAGKVPGGYFKREGRPSEKETLTSRLIDRPIRPLFPKEFVHEIQIIATVLSLDHAVPTDIPALIGASAALSLTGVPFQGPVAAARVGYIDGCYVLNPSFKQLDHSQLDLVVSGTADAVLMVESQAQQLPELVMLNAVMFGHQHMQPVIQAINELVEEAGGGRTYDWEPPAKDADLAKRIDDLVEKSVAEAYTIPDKLERQERLQAIQNELMTSLGTGAQAVDPQAATSASAAAAPEAKEVSALFHDIERRVVRERILEGEPRIDGRDTLTVRPIDIKVGVVPRAHGSAVFTRGETQALVVTTLGTDRDAQIVDDLESERRETFMLHYNFPPYAVNEVGPFSGPKRREIGHGRLARKALMSVVPRLQHFPYVTRVVSEITESNGSSSMASVCGGSLALMDAGVPIQQPVAGIAMGLIKEGDRYAVLTDILGDEDHLGDMDFKVAGTEQGVTALQMDIKISGITKEIMDQALKQAREARLHILDRMNDVLSEPRQYISDYAPRILTMKVKPEKIRDIIGKGGATIREITEHTRSTIDISEDGLVKIAAMNRSDGEEARRRIELLTAEVEVGSVYEGTVVKIMDFGALVNILPGRQGLVHISQISDQRIENIGDHLKEGQRIRVKVTEIDRQGRIRLSIKALRSNNTLV